MKIYVASSWRNEYQQQIVAESWLPTRTADECRPHLMFIDESYVEKVRAK